MQTENVLEWGLGECWGRGRGWSLGCGGRRCPRPLATVPSTVPRTHTRCWHPINDEGALLSWRLRKQLCPRRSEPVPAWTLEVWRRPLHSWGGTPGTGLARHPHTVRFPSGFRGRLGPQTAPRIPLLSRL